MVGPYWEEGGYTFMLDLDQATVEIKKDGETMTIDGYIKRLVMEALLSANQMNEMEEK